MAQTIRESVRDTDFVARLAGAEFASILFHCNCEQAPNVVGENARRDCIRSIPLGGHDSSGGRERRNHRDHISDHIREPDHEAGRSRLHTAKRAGRDRISSYEQDNINGEEHHTRLRRVAAICDALTQNGFLLYAQKIAPTDAGNIPHCELLVRMIDRNGDLRLQSFIRPRNGTISWPAGPA